MRKNALMFATLLAMVAHDVRAFVAQDGTSADRIDLAGTWYVKAEGIDSDICSSPLRAAVRFQPAWRYNHLCQRIGRWT